MLKIVLEHVLKQLVDKPERLQIVVSSHDQREIYEIHVDEQDRGKVIGREGQTIKALRMLMNAIKPEGKEVLVTIADNK